MISVALMLMQVVTQTDFGPRLATLQAHFERLGAITVVPELNAEKETRLHDLKTQLDKGATTTDEFNALYFKMDEVRSWLWEHSLHKPMRAAGDFEETTSEWIVTNPHLEFHWNRDDLSMRVKTAKASWQFAPSDEKDIVIGEKRLSLSAARNKTATAFPTGYSVGMTLALSDFEDAPGLELILCANLIGDEIVFEVVPREGADGIRMLRWPKPIELDASATAFSVIPFMQGMLLPGNWPDAVAKEELCHSRTLYMPWWGQIQDGAGALAILETSDDAGVRYEHAASGPTIIQPMWHASLGRLEYTRVIRYVFDDASTYVSLAKRYRRYVQEKGLFVSLKEKLARTPNLQEVIGRPVIHLGALYHFVQSAQLFTKDPIENNHALTTFDTLAKQLRDVKGRGLDDAYVHLDGWGFFGYDNGHPDVMPVGEEQGGWDGLRRFADTCDELGYLFATHDQYRDFYLNAASFDDRLVALRADGSREQHSTWCGGPQTILSPWFAPGYVRRNHDLFAEYGVKVKGAYLDVFAVVPLEESSQKEHPLTRTDCARLRRECFDLLRARGYVVSSEEPADYLVRSLDLVHHGPYGTGPKIGGGSAVGIPVPLFNLVYHDSILLPWEMGEDGGWGIPKGDAGRLHCLLNAGLPYVSPGVGADDLAKVHEAATLAARCGTAEMIGHEFLDGSYRKQRTLFADGTQVSVDFDAKTYSIVSSTEKQ